MSTFRSTPSRRASIRLIQGLSLLMIQSSYAATGIWMGSPGDALWEDSAQWVNGLVPGANGSTSNQDVATFSTAGTTTITTPNSWNLKSFQFEPTAGAFVFGGNPAAPLRLSSGGEITLQSAYRGGSVQFNTPLLLQGHYTFKNVSTNEQNFVAPPKLIFTGAISNDTSGDITLNLAGSAGSRSRSVNEANLISGIISDGTAGGKTTVSVSGTTPERGAWNLSGLNSFTGDFVSTGGTTFANTLKNKGVASSLGAGQTLSMSGGSALVYYGSSATSTNRDVLVAGSGGFTWYNQGGKITVDESASITLTSGPLTFRGTGAFDINAKITGVHGVTRTDGGTVQFNNSANDFTGNISISQGSFIATHIADSGVASSLGRGNSFVLGQTNGGTGLINNTGRIGFNTASDQSTNRSIQITNGLNTSVAVGGGILENLNANTVLTFSGNVTATNTSVRSTLEIGGVGHGVMTGTFSGSANTEVTKSGAGTWELRGANTHRGGVVVNAGTLLVSNSTGSGTGLGNLTVNQSATLGGTGSASGATDATLSVASTAFVMVGHSHGQLLGSATTTRHQAEGSLLTLGSATNVQLDLNGTLQFDIFSNESGITQTEADRLALATTASTLNLGGKIAIANSTGFQYSYTEGEWQLFDWSGVNFSNTTLEGTPQVQTPSDLLRIGYRWDTSELYSTGVLRSVADETAFIWTGAEVENDRWNNSVNWVSGGIPTEFNDVIFGDVTGAVGAVVKSNLAEDRTIRNLLLTGERNYEISSTQGVLYMKGDMVHSISGQQKITVQVRPNKSGKFTVRADDGMLDVSNIMAAAGISGDWHFEGAGDMTVNNLSRRSNSTINLVKNGTGTLTIRGFTALSGEEAGGFTAAGSYLRGKVTVNEGTLRIQDERSLGGTPNNFTADQLTINGGRLLSFGNMVIDDANRGITIGSRGATFAAEESKRLEISTVMRGPGDVVIDSLGEVRFSQGNTYTGDTYIAAGSTLWVTNPTGSATGTGNVHLQASTILGGNGRMTPKAGGSFTAHQYSAIIVGNDTTTASTLTLGDPSSPLNVEIALHGLLQLDVTGAGLYANLGDSAYLSNGSNLADLLVLSTTGNLDLSGLQIDLGVVSTDAWAGGQTWKLLDWSSANPQSVTTTGMGLMVDSFNSFQLGSHITSDGFYVYVIPEPSKSMLALVGLAGLMLRRRKAVK